jgi:ubiquinone/menaquinone biosynthesis C-methylase UbiE/DNA-binding transcriptional ArsR family regulator
MNTLLTALRATAEPTRLRIVALCLHGELTVSELMHILGQSQPRVSRHLKLLCDAGLLDRFQEGSWVFHRAVHDGEGLRILRALEDLMPDDDAMLTRDALLLKQIKHDRAAQAAAYFRANAIAWDKVRSLHVDDQDVEHEILNMLPEYGIETLLDVGTGTGRILELLGPRIQSGLGIDASRDMLAVARSHLDHGGFHHCQVRQADMYRTPLANAAYDAAIIHQVLHFADDPAAAINETARTLRPGGMMLIIDFAPHSLEQLRRDHEHRRLGFTDGEISEWMLEAGLEPQRINHLDGEKLTVTLWLGIKPENVPVIHLSAVA